MHRGILRTNLSSPLILPPEDKLSRGSHTAKDSPELQGQSRTEPGLPRGALKTPDSGRHRALREEDCRGGLRVGAGVARERGMTTVLTYVGMVQNLHYSYC